MSENKVKISTKKALMIGGGILALTLIGTVGYLLYKKHKDGKPISLRSIASGLTGGTGGFRCEYTGYPVRYGSCGIEVKTLQQYLNKKYNAGLNVDGKFGSLTKEAALKYLKKEKFTESEINQYK